MRQIACEVAVIGGGPAGLSAAAAAKEAGASRVLVIERDRQPGGILQQCIHPGFGLNYFRQELTGPEYAERCALRAKEAGVDFLLSTMVLQLDPDGTLHCVSGEGVTQIYAKSVVLAMGCRERTRGSIRLPGARPAGIYTAGAAQRLLNRQNILAGKNIVILGSGDIGMIMARRFTLEGARVGAVVELMPYLAGLTRNRVQCLEDFGIPLLLSHTVTRVLGNDRVRGVEVSAVDDCQRPAAGTERTIPCDTLVLSVGLIPENELSRMAGVELDPLTGGPKVNQFMQTSVPHIFAAGNVLHVNDLADNVSVESEAAGAWAAEYAAGRLREGEEIEVLTGGAVRYVCPQKIRTKTGGRATFYFRVAKPGKNAKITARSNGELLQSKTAQRVNPGEMESLTIELDKVEDLKIEVVGEAL